MITLVNGGVQNPSNMFVPNGSIKFQLNVDATVIASPFGFVCADIPVVFQLDANGNILPNIGTTAQIWSNAELNPQDSAGLGTYYLVTIYDQDGARLNRVPMWWQFSEAANSTVNISDIAPYSTVGGNVIFYPTIFSFNFEMPSEFSVSGGSPVANSGTVDVTWNPAGQGLVFAGPAMGGSGVPTFRALVLSDLPGGSSGTVTSVGLSLAVPASIFTSGITGSPVTTSGTIAATISLQNQNANTVLAGPVSGSPAPPTFRALGVGDGITPIINSGSATGSVTTSPVDIVSGFTGKGTYRVSVYLYTIQAGSTGTATVSLMFDNVLTGQTVTTDSIDLSTLASFQQATFFLDVGTGLLTSAISYTVTVSGASGTPIWRLVYAVEQLGVTP